MAELQQVKLGQLHESPFNPRQKFDGLEELAESIRANGVIQPLIVRKTGDNGAGFEIIAGARRYRAAKLAKQDTVPVLVRDLNDTEARTEQILENLQREDIAPLEEATAYQELLKANNSALPAQERATGGAVARPLDVEQLAQRVGKSKRYVYARLELLKLSAPVQKALAAGKIEPSHAQELVPLKPEQQREMLSVIEFGSGMSIEETRDEIAQRYTPKKTPKVSAKEKARRAREAAESKERAEAYKRQQAKSEAERALQHQVTARAVAALWSKLKAADGKAREWLLDIILANAARSRGVGAALRVAKGLPLPERWVSVSMPEFTKRPRGERIAAVILAEAIDRSDYYPKEVEPLYRWAKINTKAIAKQIQAEQKAAAAKAAKPVQTSAKSQKAAARGKAKTKRAA